MRRPTKRADAAVRITIPRSAWRSTTAIISYCPATRPPFPTSTSSARALVLTAPPSASFPFIDLATGERWTVRANDGLVPWWILDPARRVPGARLREYLALAKLLRAKAGATIGETISCSGPLYARLIEPLLIVRAQHRAAKRFGGVGGGDHPGDARRRRAQLSPVDRSQWSFQRFRRAGASIHRRPWRQRELWSPASPACARRRPCDGARLRRRVYSR